MFLAMVMILAACILSAILYRMGGAKGYDTKWRDVGCPLIFLGLIVALFGLNMAFWWVYVITFGLSWAALSTYYDKIFGYDNFYAHGLGCSLAALSLCFVIPCWIILIRIIICTIGMGLWSVLIDNDVKEELGRGVLFII